MHIYLYVLGLEEGEGEGSHEQHTHKLSRAASIGEPDQHIDAEGAGAFIDEQLQLLEALAGVCRVAESVLLVSHYVCVCVCVWLCLCVCVGAEFLEASVGVCSV